MTRGRAIWGKPDCRTTYLSAKLIQLFQEPATNPRGARLIFTSHDFALLGRVQGRDVLRRDQIWFTEKDGDGSTQVFPPTDFKPRKEENRERRYLAGRYGAVPNVDDELFAAALRPDRAVSEAAVGGGRERGGLRSLPDTPARAQAGTSAVSWTSSTG